MTDARAPATPAARRPLTWQLATVVGLVAETSRVRTLTLQLPGWQAHAPGQHVDIRLTAEDGYQAQRSYSIASAPTGEPTIALTIERVQGGEVSPFLHDDVVVGDTFEVRGPIGGYFVWYAAMSPPLLLVAGGSGVVPLMAILRHRANVASGTPCTLLYSSRTTQDIIYAQELAQLAASDEQLRVLHTLTRAQPAGWTGYGRRIDAQMLGEVLAGTGQGTRAFVCGPTPLVELGAQALVGLGLEPSDVRTERFGPSGG